MDEGADYHRVPLQQHLWWAGVCKGAGQGVWGVQETGDGAERRRWRSRCKLSTLPTVRPPSPPPSPGLPEGPSSPPTVSAMVRPKASCTPSEEAAGVNSNWRNDTKAKPAMRADRLEMALSCSARSSTSRLRQGARAAGADARGTGGSARRVRHNVQTISGVGGDSTRRLTPPTHPTAHHPRWRACSSPRIWPTARARSPAHAAPRPPAATPAAAACETGVGGRAAGSGPGLQACRGVEQAAGYLFLSHTQHPCSEHTRCCVPPPSPQSLA